MKGVRDPKDRERLRKNQADVLVRQESSKEMDREGQQEWKQMNRFKRTYGKKRKRLIGELNKKQKQREGGAVRKKNLANTDPERGV